MSNASLFFPHEKDDDLFDLYEERLFEDKQFFTSRAIIPSLFDKRFDKMMKREDAFRQLTGTETISIEESNSESKESTNISDAYYIYQTQRANILLAIFLAKDIPTTITLIQQLVHVFEIYSSYWVLNDSFDASEVLISKEPEPVLFSKAIQSFENAGGKKIEDLHELTFEGKETLLCEAKRLSLWRKKEIDNGNF